MLCSNFVFYLNVDEVFFEEKLKDFNLEYEFYDIYVGMVVLLIDCGFIFENFLVLLKDQEFYVYVVNFGENESENSFCFCQFR